MSLPVSILAGLAALLLYGDLDTTLPGAESPWRLALTLPLCLLPALLVRWATPRLVGLALRPRTRFLYGVLTRALSSSVPVVYAVIVYVGDLPVFVERAVGASSFLQLVLALAPLAAAEFSLRKAGDRLSAWMGAAGLDTPMPVGGERLAMAWFVLVPVLLFGLLTDVVFSDRRLDVVFQATTAGNVVGLLCVVALFSVALPILFRWILPVTPKLPASVATDVHTTAQALGFPPRSVLLMRSGHRMVNAALVGLLPWPRYLVVSDGLVTLLDRLSLQGVIAHEIGHARANHPLWMVTAFLVAPLLAAPAAVAAGIEDLETADLVMIGLGLATAAWLAVRTVSHRFEHEADTLSAEALGGAEPCVRALQHVGELSPRSIHRASFRHPSEQRRIRHLLAYERDPAYRRRFQRRGRILRALVLAACAGGAWLGVEAQTVLWPVEHALVLYSLGDFPAAQERLRVVPTQLPTSYRRLVEDLRAELDAARAILPRGGPWEQIREDLATRARRRGLEIAAREGPRAARPWLALATAGRGYDPLGRSLYLWADAVAEGDAPAARRIAEHVLRRFRSEVPPAVAERLAETLAVSGRRQ